jgi:hypothetical protein
VRDAMGVCKRSGLVAFMARLSRGALVCCAVAAEGDWFGSRYTVCGFVGVC